jgi:hypothetical protein
MSIFRNNFTLRYDRKRQLLSEISKDDLIIELGPLHNAIAAKRDGWQTTIVDHDSQAEIINKYKNDPAVDINLIEEVDIIWKQGPLAEAFSPTQYHTFQAIIASHVIEHIPDFIGFFQSAQHLLNPDSGVLVLAVPDKRFCFDAFRPVSTTGRILEAHTQNVQRHSRAALFDHLAYSVHADDRCAWGRETPSKLSFSSNIETALSIFEAWSSDSSAPYIDCHGWQFTPASFELLIMELSELGLIDWRIDWIKPRPSTEFLVHLRPGYTKYPTQEFREAHRLQLQREIMHELREQANWLLGNTGFLYHLKQTFSPIRLAYKARTILQNFKNHETKHF